MIHLIREWAPSAVFATLILAICFVVCMAWRTDKSSEIGAGIEMIFILTIALILVGYYILYLQPPYAF